MPEVLSGSMPGVTVADAMQIAADHCGYRIENDRFRTMVLSWIKAVIQRISAAHPMLRRTVVIDAPFTLVAGTSLYDVRKPVADGGFGWDNCYQVLTMRLPEVSSRSLEPMKIDQWYNRTALNSDQGPSYGWVLVDQFRIKMVPTPDQAYEGTGDYTQDLPVITSDGQTLDWVRAFDVSFREGILFEADRWQYREQPALWKGSEKRFEALVAEIGSIERTTNRRPSKAVVTRSLLSRRRIVRDRSTDQRYRN